MARKLLLVACLAALPVAAALAHPDSTQDVPKGRYSFDLQSVDVNVKKGKVRGYVFGHVQVWVDGHAGRSDLVFGPLRIKARRGVFTFPINKTIYAHEDCSPAETMHVEARVSRFTGRADIPERFRSSNGKLVGAAARKAVADVLDNGTPIPVARDTADLADNAPQELAGGRASGRFDIDLHAEAGYEEEDGTSCGGGGTPTETTGTQTTPPAQRTVTIADPGYEHPNPPAASEPYSAVCGDVVVDPAAALTGTAKLQREGPPGTWTDYGAAEPFATGADGRATVKLGISQANSRYRIVATLAGGGTTTSDPVDVGAGTAGTGTRDCYPPD